MPHDTMLYDNRRDTHTNRAAVLKIVDDLLDRFDDRFGCGWLRCGNALALGSEYAGFRINQAKKEVAEQERDGEIGKANAEQERRVQVSAADASAVEVESAETTAPAE